MVAATCNKIRLQFKEKIENPIQKAFEGNAQHYLSVEYQLKSAIADYIASPIVVAEGVSKDTAMSKQGTEKVSPTIAQETPQVIALVSSAGVISWSDQP